MRPNTELLESRRATIANLAQAGYNTAEIAAQLGVTRRTVQRHLSIEEPVLTVESRRDTIVRLTSEGFSAAAIATQLGITVRSVQRNRQAAGISRNPSPPMSAEETAAALALLKDGASYCEVARTIGRSPQHLRIRFPGYGWNAKLGAEYRRAMQKLDALRSVVA